MAGGHAFRKYHLVGSMGTIGDCYDNAPMESFWGSMQIELLNNPLDRGLKRPVFASPAQDAISRVYGDKKKVIQGGGLSSSTYG